MVISNNKHIQICIVHSSPKKVFQERFMYNLHGNYTRGITCGRDPVYGKFKGPNYKGLAWIEIFERYLHRVKKIQKALYAIGDTVSPPSYTAV